MFACTAETGVPERFKTQLSVLANQCWYLLACLTVSKWRVLCLPVGRQIQADSRSAPSDVTDIVSFAYRFRSSSQKRPPHRLEQVNLHDPGS
jgi:hypothetical protein